VRPPPLPTRFCGFPFGRPTGARQHVIVFFGLCLLLSRLTAQTTLYWDRNNNANGAGNAGQLPGTWDTTTANWSTAAAGNIATTTFTSGSIAVFSAGTNASGQTYTITVSGTQNTAGISIEEGTVTFSGGTAINFNDSTPDFFVTSGLTTTVQTDISGTNGLTKLGAGTLVLAANDKSYTGTTTLSAGTLRLDFNQTFDTVSLAGGTLALNSASTTITTLNITANSVIDFSSSATLNVTTLTLSAGVTLTVRNWQNATDYFFAANWTGAVYNTTDATPMNQIVFDTDGSDPTTYSASQTKWQSYDQQVTPVPEARVHGLILVGTVALFFATRRLLCRPALLAQVAAGL